MEQLGHVDPLPTAAQRVAAAFHDGLRLVVDDLVGKVADRTVVQVERFAVDIGLARDGCDGDLVVVLLFHKLEERLANGLARAHDAAIGGPAQILVGTAGFHAFVHGHSLLRGERRKRNEKAPGRRRALHIIAQIP